ncbi:MAG: spore protease YyaC [Candidatus Desulforudis sp.]|nr:spore protease YyaC [Desulforudis sp.]
MPGLQSTGVSEVFIQHYAARFVFSQMCHALDREFPRDRKITFVCIGIDRSTGDSFGPLTGTLLKQLGVQNVFGTLEVPVHAGNLVRMLEGVDRDMFVVAIDAALGRAEDLGKIYVRRDPLRPGTAVDRDLPPVGDLSLVMNVNVAGVANHLFLNHASLNIVWRGAQIVARSIVGVLYRIRKEPGSRSALDR